PNQWPATRRLATPPRLHPPEVFQMPMLLPNGFMELKPLKTRSGKTEQKNAGYRKIQNQNDFTPEKCSTIRAQQFPRGTVKSGTSRPRIVQQFKPKSHNNSGKKNRLPAPALAQNSLSEIFLTSPFYGDCNR
ncbi:MAG: hypothetical protein JXB10_12450, partial [Pirellulales bacterium]|nr:hypothetical protein [Pirellulales bacterium]